MNKRRQLSLENLELRRLLAAGAGAVAAWESVIVSLNEDVDHPRAVGQGAVHAYGGQLGHVYDAAIKGFSAQLPPAALVALSKNPHVKLIEPDLRMQAFTHTIPTGIRRIEAEQNPIAKIDGIDERVDIDIAIIDSGIDVDHPDLNVVGGRRFYSVHSGPPKNRGTFGDDRYDDDAGHGTHVAGTAAALDNDFGVVGVAPGARLWAVKVLDSSGSGYLSDIIAGVDWVTRKNQDSDPGNDIEIANMSLGGVGTSIAYHDAIKAGVEEGIVFVAAAGNSYRDILGPDFQFGTSDDTIPAAYPEVMTISAMADTDGQYGAFGSPTNYFDPYIYAPYADDTYADFSNKSNDEGPNSGFRSWYDTNNKVSSPGLGIDLMMPGVDILSTYPGGYAISSGTSMAAPHAAGLAALYIAEHGPATNEAGVYAIRQALIDSGKAWTSPEGLKLPTPPSPNPDSPDNHIENLGWAGPTVPVESHDVAITLVTTNPENVVLGNPIDIQVVVANHGTFSESFSVEVIAAGQALPLQDVVSLAAGATTTLHLTWTPVAAGSVNITASATAVEGETDFANNTSTTSVQIMEPIHNVAIAATDTVPTVVQGDQFTASFAVTNLGTYVEENVVVTAVASDGTNLGSATISRLGVGDTVGLDFTWATDPGLAPGDYALTATVQAVSEEQFTDDNAATVHIVVTTPPPAVSEATIDDGEAGFSATSEWSAQASGAAFGGDYQIASPGNGSAKAIWNFGSLPPGSYDVYATWTSHPKKQASNAPFLVNGTAVSVNQRTSPNGSEIAGWQLLATVAVTSAGDFVVELSNAANGNVVADAVRVQSSQSSMAISSANAALPPLDSPAAATLATPRSPEAQSLAVNDPAAADMYFSTLGAIASAPTPQPDQPQDRQSSKAPSVRAEVDDLRADLLCEDSLDGTITGSL